MFDVVGGNARVVLSGYVFLAEFWALTRSCNVCCGITSLME